MFDPTGRNINMGSNLWLVYIPGESVRKDAINVFRNSKLRLDSLVFEFYREYHGISKRLFENTNLKKKFRKNKMVKISISF